MMNRSRDPRRNLTEKGGEILSDRNYSLHSFEERTKHSSPLMGIQEKGAITFYSLLATNMVI